MKTMFIGPLNRTSDSIYICGYAIAVIIGDAAEGILVGRNRVGVALAKCIQYLVGVCEVTGKNV